MSYLSSAKQVDTEQKGEPGVRKMVYTHVTIGLFFLSLAIGGIYLCMRSNQAIASLGLTVIVVVGIGILCWAEDVGTKAEKFNDRAIAWKPEAASPEEGVGGLLEALPDSYSVFHNFVTKKGCIDHIVVGPKGILAIETKSPRGVVSDDRGRLLLDGHPFENDVVKQAWERCYVLRGLLAEKGVCTLRPKPLIVFTDADVQVKERVRGAQVIGIEDLQASLDGLPVWMSDRLSKGINACLRSIQNG
jgi:hypothetical protein